MTEGSRRGALGWVVSVTLHAAAFLAGGLILFHAPVFGVQEAPSSSEVELVASTESPTPPAPVTKVETPPVSTQAPPPIIPETKEDQQDDMALHTQPPVPTPPQSPPPLPQPAVTPTQRAHQAPSKHPLSKKSQAPSGGQKGVKQAQPDYLRNPPPVYPQQARLEHRQGVVLIIVSVSSSGDPTSVSLGRSSGHDDFDQSAIRAVRGWKFQPASAGGMSIPSTIGIPVNFELR